uniref:Uncharacterized protein n=1 Tax=Oryza brachyantha TaxID=4533 RepID=J3MPM2_ORYBR
IHKYYNLYLQKMERKLGQQLPDTKARRKDIVGCRRGAEHRLSLMPNDRFS